jgi:hypothetical protein
MLLDGTLIPTRRRSGTANRRNYNGKHKKHGLLFLALTDQAGNLTWISSARRGAASEITTARHDHIAGHLRAGPPLPLNLAGLVPLPQRYPRFHSCLVSVGLHPKSNRRVGLLSLKSFAPMHQSS